MTTRPPTEIRIRPGNQTTLPDHIVKLANLRVGDRLTVSYADGCIVLMPVRSSFEHTPNEALSKRLLAPASEKGYQDYENLDSVLVGLKK